MCCSPVGCSWSTWQTRLNNTTWKFPELARGAVAEVGGDNVFPSEVSIFKEPVAHLGWPLAARCCPPFSSCFPSSRVFSRPPASSTENLGKLCSHHLESWTKKKLKSLERR
jgi:hypothetical protein